MKSILSSSARNFLAFGLVALFVQSAFAHTYLSTVVLGGNQLAEGDCVRPHPQLAYDSPIPLVSSPDMTCGWLPAAAGAANRRCPIAAGSQMGIIWHHQSNAPTDDIVDPSHKGPIMFYLAKSDTGAGNVWFKIYQDGYDAATNTWATDKMIANRGLVTFTLPSDIAPGNYLLRGEILALHGAYAVNGVQPYVGCVELTISGSGNANPSGVAFPGAYVNTGAGLVFDVYSAYTSYPIPGPAVYVSGGSSPSTTPQPTARATAAPSPVTAAPATAAPSPVTAAPTAAPGSSSSICLQMSGGSSVWWLGVVVTGGSETTVKVEITDSGRVSSWTALVDQSYAFVFSQNLQLTLPVSVRLTSSTGKQVVMTNAFTSWTSSLVNTGKNYGTTGTSAPTQRATPAPTQRATSAPTQRATPAPTQRATAAPTQGATASPSSVSVMVYPSANMWWFALTVNGVSMSNIKSVSIKDSGAYSTFQPMIANSWGFAFNTQGSPLVAPLTVQITSTAGRTVTATVSSITPTAVFPASGSL